MLLAALGDVNPTKSSNSFFLKVALNTQDGSIDNCSDGLGGLRIALPFALLSDSDGRLDISLGFFIISFLMFA